MTRTLLRTGVTALFAVSMLGVAGPVPASAAVACTPPGVPANGVAVKNIDTTLGCNNPSGNATNPATGWITVHMPVPVPQANVFDWFTGGPGGAPYVGNYTATFVCQGGSATPGNYSFDGTTFSGSPSLWTTGAGGAMSCQYTVTFLGTPPAGVTTLQNNAQFLLGGGGLLTATSPVVLTFAAPAVPEVPLTIALPVLGVAIVAAFLAWSRRRARSLVVGVK